MALQLYSFLNSFSDYICFSCQKLFSTSVVTTVFSISVCYCQSTINQLFNSSPLTHFHFVRRLFCVKRFEAHTSIFLACKKGSVERPLRKSRVSVKTEDGAELEASTPKTNRVDFQAHRFSHIDSPCFGFDPEGGNVPKAVPKAVLAGDETAETLTFRQRNSVVKMTVHCLMRCPCEGSHVEMTRTTTLSGGGKSTT